MKDFLPPVQQSLLRLLSTPLHDLGYYLVGGTAVALHFRHRLSVDLDWFTTEPMGDAVLLAGHLQRVLPIEITDLGPGTLHVISEGVRVTFLEYGYPLLHPVGIDQQYSCPVASLDDLACMKLSAIAQRGSRKDFIDLYTIAQHHRPLTELLDLYRRKYAVENVTPVLYGMAYFDNAVQEPMPAQWHGDWEDLEQDCLGWVREAWQTLSD